MQAIQCYDEAIRINPDLAMAWNNKGVAYHLQGNHSEAIRFLDEAIRINPDFGMAWNNKGNAYANLGNFTEAIHCYDLAIGLDPDDALAWNNKGRASGEQGNYTEAIRCYDEAPATASTQMPLSPGQGSWGGWPARLFRRRSHRQLHLAERPGHLRCGRRPVGGSPGAYPHHPPRRGYFFALRQSFNILALI